MAVSPLPFTSARSITDPLIDAALPPQVQLSNLRSVYQSFCCLNELVNDLVYVLNLPVHAPKAADILQLYQRFLSWYDELPEVMKLGQNCTPPVIFIQYVPLSFQYFPFFSILLCQLLTAILVYITTSLYSSFLIDSSNYELSEAKHCRLRFACSLLIQSRDL